MRCIKMLELELRAGRILHDMPCKVCQDYSSGKHYGIFACDGCAGFFKRSIRRNRQYVCKSKGEAGCLVDKSHRNQCRACRLHKCVQAGMNKDAVQHERGPRNSTIRRQMSLYFKETSPSRSPPVGPPSTSPVTLPKSMTLAHSPSPSISFPHLPLMKPLSLPFHLPPFPPPMECKRISPTNMPLPLTPKTPGLDLPRTTPELPSLAINRLHSFPPRPTHLFAPTPKYPHEMFMAPFLSSPNSVCETAARLLFMNISWVKHLPAFASLPFRDQILLLEESWRELFVLSAAQFMLPVEAYPLISQAGLQGEHSDVLVKLLQEIKLFQETIEKFKSMAVDPTEYACLKAIILFQTGCENSPGEEKSLRDSNTIDLIQEQSQVTLNKYIRTAYPNQQFRFGKLLLLLPSLKSISSRSIEEIFFRRTIGSVSTEKIITDLYKSSDFI